MFSVSQLPKAPENARSTATEAFNADSQTDNPQLCEAKRENNPSRGSFPARFTVLSNRVLTNRKQLPNMDKLSQKILPLLCEQSLERSGKVCKGFASQSSSTSCHTEHARAVGRAQLVTPTVFQSTEPGSGLLNRKVGICTRKVCDMSNASRRLKQPLLSAQTHTIQTTVISHYCPQTTVPPTNYSTNGRSWSHFQPHFSVTAVDSSTP